MNVENREGYIIYELKAYYEIEFLSVYQGMDHKLRIPKETKFDFDDIERIGELQLDNENSCRDGQAFYKVKWYSKEMINKILKR